MRRTIDGVIASLAGSKDVHSQYEQVENWASSGNVDLLYELGVALVSKPFSPPASGWAADAVLDHIKTVLALTQGTQYAEALTRLAILEESGETRRRELRLHRIASVLAASQPVDVLATLFENHSDDDRFAELLMLLAQEMVLRGVDCLALPVVVLHCNRMLERNHPLTRLPLSLISIETQLSLRHYNMRGESSPLPFGPIRSREIPSKSETGVSRFSMAVKETTTGAETERIKTVVAKWEAESNGVSEARIFMLEMPIKPDALSAALLVSLGLNCLADNGRDEIRTEPASLARVFGVLFAAASLGGAYSKGAYGPYGRLEAWRSLAALVGVSEDSEIEVICDTAERSAWMYFEADTEWFQQVAWDFGIVGLRPDGATLAVLAATDTD